MLFYGTAEDVPNILLICMTILILTHGGKYCQWFDNQMLCVGMVMDK